MIESVLVCRGDPWEPTPHPCISTLPSRLPAVPAALHRDRAAPLGSLLPDGTEMFVQCPSNQSSPGTVLVYTLCGRELALQHVSQFTLTGRGVHPPVQMGCCVGAQAQVSQIQEQFFWFPLVLLPARQCGSQEKLPQVCLSQKSEMLDCGKDWFHSQFLAAPIHLLPLQFKFTNMLAPPGMERRQL